MQSAATLGGEINIKEVTFRFYANIKDAKHENIHDCSLKFYLELMEVKLVKCSQQRDKMSIRSGINGIYPETRQQTSAFQIRRNEIGRRGEQLVSL